MTKAERELVAWLRSPETKRAEHSACGDWLLIRHYWNSLDWCAEQIESGAWKAGGT